MPVSRRLWDSSVVIGYLAGDQRLNPACSQIIRQAERRETEILVSQMAIAETAYLRGQSDGDSERLIREFFTRDYIVPVSVDGPVSTVAQNLVRKYRNSPSIKAPDAIHLATAILWRIPVMETIDDPLIRFNQLEGSPRVSVRCPLYDGRQRLPGLL